MLKTRQNQASPGPSTCTQCQWHSSCTQQILGSELDSASLSAHFTLFGVNAQIKELSIRITKYLLPGDPCIFDANT